MLLFILLGILEIRCAVIRASQNLGIMTIRKLSLISTKTQERARYLRIYLQMWAVITRCSKDNHKT